MKISSPILVLFIIVLLPFTGMTQQDGFSEVENIDLLKEKLNMQAKETTSIESDFIQQKHLWMLEEVLVSEGRFLFKKENSVRWQYDTPVEYLILIHDNKFSIVSNGKVSKFDTDSNPMFQQINNMIVAAIRGDFINNTDFTTEFYENDSLYLSILVPKIDVVSSMLSAIEIYFSKNDMQVSKVIFREPGDDLTIISFVNKKINIDIPEEEFILSY